MKRALKIGGVVAALLILAFMLLRSPDTDPAAMRAKYGGPPSQFVTLASGQVVHLRDEGPRDAPAIVLLHGSNADLHTWQPWVDALEADYRVIRYDQIGHGLTGAARDDNYAPTAYVRDVGEVADALGLKHFILGGNSMGGAVALAYAAKNGDRVDGLVLIDAAGARIPEHGKGNLAFTIARVPGIGWAMASILPRRLVKRSLSQSVVNQGVVTNEAVDRYWELARYPGNRAATRARFAQAPFTVSSSHVAAVQVPTLVMWGDEDPLIPLAAGRWYAAHLPEAAFVHYPHIGHLPMEEAPERSVADLRAWLRDLPSHTRQGR